MDKSDYPQKGSAYKFADEVDRLIESLSYADYHRRRDLAKDLREELLPLSRLALLLKLPGLGVQVEAFQDNGRADGMIWITGFRERAFEVQITYAGYDREDHLRSELLVEKGFTPGTGSITRDKRTAPIVAEMGAQDIESHRTSVSSALVKAFQRKKAKPYAEGTVLLIAFEEVKIYGQLEWSSLLGRIEEFGGMHDSQFAEVYLFNAATNQIIRAA